MKKLLSFFFLSVLSLNLFSQEEKPKFNFSAYGELYYGYDFDNPDTHERPFFLYNHKRHNELNLNLALVKGNYSTDKVRANLALMAGNYAQNNLSSEPTLLQFVNEANIGIKLSKKRNIWLDAGIMPSHIGVESAIGADCWTASRSVVAESSPYFETGVKVTSTNAKENFYMSFLVLNGWQTITKSNGINRPSFGMQFNYKPKDNITLNYSNFVGSVKPDTLNAIRTYHNLYMQYEINSKFGITAGIDIGSDKGMSDKYKLWYAPLLILKANISKKSTIALRAEYFGDEGMAYLPSIYQSGYKILGFSLNYDLKIFDKVLFRIEGRRLSANNSIYQGNKSNYALLSTLSVKI